MMTEPLVRVQRRKLSDEVRVQLVALIEEGLPGDLLPSERDLMDRLGVGRPAIREAMQALEQAGLIEIRHGERARVAEPSLGRMVDQVGQSMRHLLSHSSANLENLKEARATFEREMARTAALKRSEQDLARLEQIIAEQAEHTQVSPKFRILDGRFHREIAAIGGNPIWTALSDALFGWLNDFHVEMVSVPGLEQLTLDEHRAILAAIRKGDPDLAGKVMADHLNRASDLYRRANASA